MIKIDHGNWQPCYEDRERLAEVTRKYYEALKESLKRRSFLPKDWRSRLIQ